MFTKNLFLSSLTVSVFFLLYKVCAYLGIPLYPYGLLFFLIPVFGIIPIYQYLEFRQMNGYKQHLLGTGKYSSEQLDSMSSSEIEKCWRDSLQK